MCRYELMVSRAPRGRYSSSIPIWQDHFSHVLPLPYGDVRDRPEELVASVESHLDIGKHAGYTCLRTAVHQSRPAELPTTVLAAARARVEEDEAYLRRELGDEFFDRTT